MNGRRRWETESRGSDQNQRLTNLSFINISSHRTLSSPRLIQQIFPGAVPTLRTEFCQIWIFCREAFTAKNSSYSQYSIQSSSFWKRKMLCKFNIEQQLSAVDQGRVLTSRVLNILCLGLTLVKTLQAGDKTMTKFQSHKMLEHN